MQAAVLVAKTCKRVSGLMAPSADQAIRAAASVPAHLMEGLAFQGKARIHRWKIGYGEAQEADRHLTLLIATDSIPADTGHEALELLDRTRAMLWRLMHPKSKT